MCKYVEWGRWGLICGSRAVGVCFVEGTVNKEYECWVCDLKVLKSFAVSFKGVKCNRARSLYCSSRQDI